MDQAANIKKIIRETVNFTDREEKEDEDIETKVDLYHF